MNRAIVVGQYRHVRALASVRHRSALQLGAGESLSVPIVLAEPSRVLLQVQPKSSGLYLSVLPERGEALLRCKHIPMGAPVEELVIPGSGVYRWLA